MPSKVDGRKDFKQDEIRTFIIKYMELHGYCPTVSEIATGTNLSVSNTHYHISNMLMNGMLETDAETNSSRALRVVGWKFVKVDKE